MAKKKLTITVDEELLQHLDDLGVENVSATINDAIKQLVEQRLRLQALGLLVDDLVAANGEATHEERVEIAALFDELQAGVPPTSVSHAA
jgi:metal-responsive CopG/Arc/MetJ family transcriptional regulator